TQIVETFEEGAFAAIIHDPPARALCKTTDMYGQRFYHQLHRVLRPGGSLFHYIGNPDSRESGRLYRGVMDRLTAAGFTGLRVDSKAFGVVGKKGAATSPH
ncbi:unnamed protein product, partial [Phaeothamnion confervicola]